MICSSDRQACLVCRLLDIFSVSHLLICPADSNLCTVRVCFYMRANMWSFVSARSRNVKTLPTVPSTFSPYTFVVICLNIIDPSKLSGAEAAFLILQATTSLPSIPDCRWWCIGPVSVDTVGDHNSVGGFCLHASETQQLSCGRRHSHVLSVWSC